MSYFNGATDPDDFDEEFSQQMPRKVRARINLAIFLIFTTLLGATFAANISLGGQRKEFGQGIYQIKACDQWVGIGLTAGSGTQNNYVKNVILYGFDPRLCVGRIFKIKLFPTGSTTPLPLYVDAAADGSAAGETTTILTLMDTSTAYTPTYRTYPDYDAYQSWSIDAVTLVNALGVNVGRTSKWFGITYTIETGVYTIIFQKPAALVAQVASVTIESAKYN